MEGCQMFLQVRGTVLQQAAYMWGPRSLATPLICSVVEMVVVFGGELVSVPGSPRLREHHVVPGSRFLPLLMSCGKTAAADDQAAAAPGDARERELLTLLRMRARDEFWLAYLRPTSER